jgi:thioredoxin 1
MTTNTQIHSLEKAMAILAAEPAVLFYFTTTSCNVGEALEPKVRNLLLAKFPLVKFYTIDLNFSSEISAEFSAFVEPTILVFFEGKETIRKSRNIGVYELQESIERPYKLIFE